MSPITPSDPATLPTLFAKVQGNQTDKLKKDDLIWHCQYESILRLTVVFLQTDKADTPDEKAHLEKALRIYLTNNGFKVISVVYYDDATTLKQYLTMK
jgi:hypothetical protein